MSHYESEIKAQLKRQAAAHRDHLADVLNVQAHELNEKHDEELTEKLTEEKIRHLDEVEKKVAKIHGIESMLTTVVDVEERNRKARKLWLAVQSLNSALATTTEDGRTKSLMPEMMAILKAAGKCTESNFLVIIMTYFSLRQFGNEIHRFYQTFSSPNF